jgi:hypothetical protein
VCVLFNEALYEYLTDGAVWLIPCVTRRKVVVSIPDGVIGIFVGIILPNEEVLLRVKDQRNILREIRKRKANWIGHFLCTTCLLQQVIEGKIKCGIEVTGRRRRRRKKLLDDLKERRGYSYFKEEALDRTMWRVGFGGSFETVVRQTTTCMNNPSGCTMALWSTQSVIESSTRDIFWSVKAAGV